MKRGEENRVAWCPRFVKKKKKEETEKKRSRRVELPERGRNEVGRVEKEL